MWPTGPLGRRNVKREVTTIDVVSPLAFGARAGAASAFVAEGSDGRPTPRSRSHADDGLGHRQSGCVDANVCERTPVKPRCDGLGVLDTFVRYGDVPPGAPWNWRAEPSAPLSEASDQSLRVRPQATDGGRSLCHRCQIQTCLFGSLDSARGDKTPRSCGPEVRPDGGQVGGLQDVVVGVGARVAHPDLVEVDVRGGDPLAVDCSEELVADG